VLSVGVSPAAPTAVLDAPASDNAPATPNTVTAFARLLRLEACFACDIVETSHINRMGAPPRAKHIVANQPRMCCPFEEEVQFLDSPRRREAALGQSKRGRQLRRPMGRKAMEWFNRKTSIAGVQIPNWGDRSRCCRHCNLVLLSIHSLKHATDSSTVQGGGKRRGEGMGSLG
jgi:hypothetical protein